MHISSTEYIDETARMVMLAFRAFGVEAGQVLLYNDLFRFLDDHADHYRDWLRDAEQVLRHESLIAPDPEGLRLTEIGHRAVHNRRS